MALWTQLKKKPVSLQREAHANGHKVATGVTGPGCVDADAVAWVQSVAVCPGSDLAVCHHSSNPTTAHQHSDHVPARFVTAFFTVWRVTQTCVRTIHSVAHDRPSMLPCCAAGWAQHACDVNQLSVLNLLTGPVGQCHSAARALRLGNWSPTLSPSSAVTCEYSPARSAACRRVAAACMHACMHACTPANHLSREGTPCGYSPTPTVPVTLAWGARLVPTQQHPAIRILACAGPPPQSCSEGMHACIHGYGIIPPRSAGVVP